MRLENELDISLSPLRHHLCNCLRCSRCLLGFCVRGVLPGISHTVQCTYRKPGVFREECRDCTAYATVNGSRTQITGPIAGKGNSSAFPYSTTNVASSHTTSLCLPERYTFVDATSIAFQSHLSYHRSIIG